MLFLAVSFMKQNLTLPLFSPCEVPATERTLLTSYLPNRFSVCVRRVRVFVPERGTIHTYLMFPHYHHLVITCPPPSLICTSSSSSPYILQIPDVLVIYSASFRLHFVIYQCYNLPYLLYFQPGIPLPFPFSSFASDFHLMNRS